MDVLLQSRTKIIQTWQIEKSEPGLDLFVDKKNRKCSKKK